MNAGTGAATVYDRFGGRAVAWRDTAGTRDVLADHLGSSQGEVQGTAELSQRRTLPFGGDRAVPGAADLTKPERFTGQWRLDAGGGNPNRELYRFGDQPGTGAPFVGGRSYLPAIGIFAQPDIAAPNLTNPQSLNRYAYAFTNPLRYVDPSGYDPLDGNWRDWWSSNVGAGSAPDWRAESLQLFAIAFPGEWAAAGGWGRFYDERGQYTAGTLEGLFNSAPETRNWAAMPAALDRLAAAYLPDETGKMVRDVDQLFAGMRSRSESDLQTAVNGGQVHDAVWLRRDATLGDAWTGGDKARPDPDANVHHWAWSVGAGYLYGETAVLMNAAREVGQGLSVGRAGVALDVDMSDVRIGTAGAYMGAWMRDRGASPADVPGLLPQSLPIGRP